ncbi:MAG: hypothetical protein NVS2B8_04710 [Vulcanimicrobiaceae bacterium]
MISSPKFNGPVGRFVLQKLTDKFGALEFDYENNDPDETSKLRQYFGADVARLLDGKVVLDFGCGRGADVVMAALLGAERVIGVEINDRYILEARALAKERNVLDRCTFINAIDESDSYAALVGNCDVIISIDAFEHFSDPKHMLEQMTELLRPGGLLLLSFGPPWLHPYGAHMNHFTTFPWLHFLFSEKVILNVRQRYVADDVRRFEDLPGGLNRMTVRRFEQLVNDAHLRFEKFEAVPIKGLKALTKNPLTRELFTSVVTAVIAK